MFDSCKDGSTYFKKNNTKLVKRITMALQMKKDSTQQFLLHAFMLSVIHGQ